MTTLKWLKAPAAEMGDLLLPRFVTTKVFNRVRQDSVETIHPFPSIFHQVNDLRHPEDFTLDRFNEEKGNFLEWLSHG